MYNLPPRPRSADHLLEGSVEIGSVEAMAMVAAVAASFFPWGKSKGTGQA